jgi:hypothetical protein
MLHGIPQVLLAIMLSDMDKIVLSAEFYFSFFIPHLVHFVFQSECAMDKIISANLEISFNRALFSHIKEHFDGL